MEWLRNGPQIAALFILALLAACGSGSGVDDNSGLGVTPPAPVANVII